jgi:hypothetical protein
LQEAIGKSNLEIWRERERERERETDRETERERELTIKIPSNSGLPN